MTRLPSLTDTTDESWRRLKSGGIERVALSEDTALAVSEIEGLIRKVIVPSSAISGVISSNTPEKTELTTSVVACSPVVPPARVDVFLVL